MSSVRPSLFIGSSSEGLAVAHALQELLHYDMDPTVWPQGLFQPNASLLQKLVHEARRYDMAAFVFVPDDDLVLRQQQYRAVRDNVVFEYGLFVGAIGLDRCFLITPFDVTDLRLPTDLLGVVPLTFNASRPDRNLVAALGPAANQIRRVWMELASKPDMAGDVPEPQETAEARLLRLSETWEQEPLRGDRAVLKAGVSDPMDDDFPRASILRVFAFLESVSDSVLSGRIPEAPARTVFGPVTRLFWPHAAVLLAFPGDPDEFWTPLPRLAELCARWSVGEP
ncbi:MAG: nucleotide-binding protein [Ramlibacter sp.]|nr:nucleotide-binding protein [Ramlibacter sp.]